MKHGKKQQRTSHLKHLEAKRERQRQNPANQPAQRAVPRLRDAPGWMQKAYIDRLNDLQPAQRAYVEKVRADAEAQVVLALLRRVRDILGQRIDQLNVAAFEADKASGKDVSVIIFNKPAEETEDDELEVASPAEVAEMIAQAPAAPAPVVCPLCKNPITLEDALRNVHVVMVNGKPVQVHKDCPPKKENKEKGDKNG